MSGWGPVTFIQEPIPQPMSMTCPACGARHSGAYTRCDLCGLTREEAARVELEDAGATPAATDPPALSDPATEAVGEGGRMFCEACGASVSATARFCSQCGERVDRPETGPPGPVMPPRSPEGDAPARKDAPAGRHALILMGAAAGVVVLLFVITQLSGRVDPLTPPPEPPATAVPAATLPDGVAQQVSILEERIAATDSGDDRMELREELVHVLVGAGAFARAGEIQEAVARERQTVDAWAEAGSFYLAHVLRNPGPDQPRYAGRSAQAFEEALALRPDDLDIMTDLATAYRYHPENPMRAVELVQTVLDADPDHARARFNYALMLAEIGRNDQAREQLERVIAIEDGDPFVRDRAREMLETMPR